MYKQEFMLKALALSQESVHHKHGQPFGAVVVKEGKVVGEGYNQVISKLDPTAHGEIEAIRDACQKLDTVNLSGCQLYTSCEPCSICVATMYVVGIEAIYYASDLTSCTKHFKPLENTIYENVDTDDLREQVGMRIEERRITSSQHESEEALVIIKNWAEKAALEESN
ncbi:nucleoside deaminase [Marinomonas rhizomae]|uniref:Cytidine/deoxycytidylate deaminase-like protein n=1 Tax=Marinomonas rhizomae TaxID=491948 RepID=A0A366IXV9_9GAMM|nr:nucleoside deaminase [Marinomonas rhizomae]RBP78538.1 cytidine/deoxycytidylate deaminase-like protein [Marinomonas rhizomae]RNF70109.1 nucleoside deaminase [Marinomonas rhizomae]